MPDIFDPPPEIKRDRYGRYLLPHPETGKERSWRRTTTFIGVLEDTYNLSQWGQRMVMRGASQRPDLVARVGAIPEDDLDKRSAKKEIGDAADTCMEVAGRSAKANLGTALHSYVEGFLRTGQIPTVMEAATRERLLAFAALLEAHDLRPVLCEAVLVNLVLDVGGQADLFVACPDGKVRVADLKSGNVDFGNLKFAMQLDAYIGAEGVYNGDGYDPMPENLDHKIGYIIHVPSTGEVEATLHGVDLVLGHEANGVAADVWKMRAKDRKAMTRIDLDGSPEPVKKSTKKKAKKATKKKASTCLVREELAEWIDKLDPAQRKILAGWWRGEGHPRLADLDPATFATIRDALTAVSLDATP